MMLRYNCKIVAAALLMLVIAIQSCRCDVTNFNYTTKVTNYSTQYHWEEVMISNRANKPTRTIAGLQATGLPSSVMVKPPVYVSLTSVSFRMSKLNETLRTIYHGIIVPTHVFLFLSREPYLLDAGVPLEDIPPSLLMMVEAGLLTIVYTQNIGPHRKLLPILHRYYDEDIIIVNVDDDISYKPESTMLYQLLAMYQRQLRQQQRVQPKQREMFHTTEKKDDRPKFRVNKNTRQSRDTSKGALPHKDGRGNITENKLASSRTTSSTTSSRNNDRGGITTTTRGSVIALRARRISLCEHQFHPHDHDDHPHSAMKVQKAYMLDSSIEAAAAKDMRSIHQPTTGSTSTHTAVTAATMLADTTSASATARISAISGRRDSFEGKASINSVGGVHSSSRSSGDTTTTGTAAATGHHHVYGSSMASRSAAAVGTPTKELFGKYAQWALQYTPGRREMLLLPTGTGGVLYQPRHFHPVVFEERFRGLTGTADDIMFRLACLARGVPVTIGCRDLEHKGRVVRRCPVDAAVMTQYRQHRHQQQQEQQQQQQQQQHTGRRMGATDGSAAKQRDDSITPDTAIPVVHTKKSRQRRTGRQERSQQQQQYRQQQWGQEKRRRRLRISLYKLNKAEKNDHQWHTALQYLEQQQQQVLNVSELFLQHMYEREPVCYQHQPNPQPNPAPETTEGGHSVNVETVVQVGEGKGAAAGGTTTAGTGSVTGRRLDVQIGSVHESPHQQLKTIIIPSSCALVMCDADPRRQKRHHHHR